MATRLDELMSDRKKKMDELVALGIELYPGTSKKDIANAEVVNNFEKYEGKSFNFAGRIMAWREHGKLIFGQIMDQSGKIQLFIRGDQLEATSKQGQKIGFPDLHLLDIGDFIQAYGEVVKTKTGEISVLVKYIKLLAKSLRPLPEKWVGLKDSETAFRKRYLDMVMNPLVIKTFIDRSHIIGSIREYLNGLGFVEIETPTLQPIYGGGFARPFVTHHNVLDQDMYLRISDEMYLKRLVVGGIEKVYEITKVFRNEGVDHDHNPEFTMFEAMIAYQDYNYGMDIIEDIIEYVAKKVFGTAEFIFKGQTISVKRPWVRMRVVEAIAKYTGVDPLSWQTLEEAKISVKSMKIDKDKLRELVKMNSIGEVIAFAFEELVENELIQPTIIYDYPVEISPLAKKCDDRRFTQRFEMFALGSELGNNYTELNDPLDLKQRFIDEKKRELAGFDEAHQTDYDYLTAIEHGFPPTCGIAIGIDRLVMLLTGSISIRDVIPFPMLRTEEPKDSQIG